MILYNNNDTYIYKLNNLFIRRSIKISLRDIVMLIAKYNVIIISI